MQHIVVNDEQARIITESPSGIEIRDRKGRHLGYVAHEFSDDDVAIAKQRLASDEPRYETRQVLDHIRSMEQR